MDKGARPLGAPPAEPVRAAGAWGAGRVWGRKMWQNITRCDMLQANRIVKGREHGALETDRVHCEPVKRPQ